jgi:adenylate cyclase
VPKVERKLTAILCADVHGYSRLMGEDEEATLHTLSAYRKIIDSLIDSHRGRFVNSAGDSILAEFTSVVEAVNCAVEIQTTLKAENADLPLGRRMDFRIGVNLGDVMVEGEQIYGDGVNIAARLESLADPGGICISDTVYAQIKNKLSLNYHDLGEQKVKNIAEPVRAWRIVPDGTPAARRPRRLQQSYWRGGTLSLTGLALAIATIFFVQHLSLKPPRSSASITPPEKPALPLPDIPSIAVLPFTNLSGDPGQEYFSDGLTETLIASLSRLPGVLVIARNSTFIYKDKTVSVQEVGRSLGVRTVLQGSVLRAGDRVRISVELADATNGANLWAQNFDQPLKDIFTVQDEIVRHLVTVLSVLFNLDNLKVPPGVLFMDRPRNNNIEAMDFEFRGTEGFWQFTKEGNEKARQMFRKAIAIDPTDPEVYAALGWTYSMDVMYQRSQNPEADLKRSSELARKALAIDDSNVLALGLMSRNSLLLGRVDQAIVNAKRILAANPNSAMGYLVLAQALDADGRPEDAIAAIQKVIRLDPAFPDMYMIDLGSPNLQLGRYQQGVDFLERYARSYPNDLAVHILLAFGYTELGRDQEAHAQAAEIMQLNPQYTLPPPEQFWWKKNVALVRREIADLRKAGLR